MSKSLALALLMAVPGVFAAEKPVITEIDRIEIAPAYQSQQLMIRDQNGEKVLVALQEITGNNDSLELAAYGSGGRKIATMNVLRPKGDQTLQFMSVSTNAQN